MSIELEPQLLGEDRLAQIKRAFKHQSSSVSAIRPPAPIGELLQHIAALEQHIIALNDRVRVEHHKVKHLCADWSEDHDHLQKLCREAGVPEPEVEGNSNTVPTIQELANKLKSKMWERVEYAVKMNSTCLKCGGNSMICGHCELDNP